MQNAKYWIWPGLVTVSALTLAAVWFGAGRIEADIALRTSQALSAQPWAEITVDARDVSVTGDAPDVAARDAAIATISSVSGVRVLEDKSGLLPLEEPYRFSVGKTDAGLAVNGFAPGQVERDRLVTDLGKALPGVSVTDNLSLARGVPAKFNEMIALGSRQLARLGEGRFEIVGDKITVQGEVLSPEDSEALAADMAAAEGFEAVADVSAPVVRGPYVFRAEQAGGKLVLSGYAPGKDDRKRLAEMAGAGVSDEVRVADGVPDGMNWTVAAAKAIEAASLLAKGSADISGRRINITGDARDLDAFRSLQQLIGSPLPGGLVLGTTDIGLPD
ncbi:hypothetical protein E2A64_10985 [Pseudohoeflea suaedae]|uniref:BON domain-containing protein n=1 Tax=Pseudohoeflea suaedae TaxID=877384 RepID=A0A4R5PJK1_9HYPH|nr:hypothetical protein [Pseudohoeflea suaedae]TDH35840.1 hypothetical protein E2A64_10985 [Pseudohoeflea suaedae]